jgi:transcriptional regulator with PAS, ATPase and Fis domain
MNGRRQPPSQVSTRDQGPSGALAERTFGVLCLVGSGASAPDGARVVRLDRRLEIGRGLPALSASQWRLADETVSRRHATIATDGGQWVVSDLGSHNGTVVDRAVVRSGSARLLDGALLVIGAHAALFRLMTEFQLKAVEADQERPVGPLATGSPVLAVTLARLRALASHSRPLLFSGETGTGKEVYARAAHELSGRSGPFVAINCASFQRDLIESELFGYKRGSHSQATEDSPGIIASAEGGTLFLDEIGEMPHSCQTKLLRFLEDKTYFGVGWRRPRRADVRIMAATQAPHQTLREDILGRLGSEPLLLPPLRRRIEDLGCLAHHFLAAGPVRRFDRATFLAMCHHPWSRNVRALQAAVIDAALVAAARGADEVALRDLPEEVRLSRLGELASDEAEPDVPAAPEGRRRRPRPAPGQDELRQLLREHRGDVPALARALDRHREQVWRWCKIFGLDPHDFHDG